jgi:glycosyltransferase involved in cell wall biosynthesis
LTPPNKGTFGDFAGPTLSEFDPAKPCLVLAPHLAYPTRNGADILIDRTWAEFSRFVPYVDVVGMDCVVRMAGGHTEHVEAYANRPRSKVVAALRAVVRHSHYLREKFLTPRFGAQARKYLLRPEYGLVACSPLCSAELAMEHVASGGLVCVFTHNDEVRWFENLRAASNNLLSRYVCSTSIEWVHGLFAEHGRDLLFLHVTAQDFDSYRRMFPTHHGAVVPIGVDARPVAPSWRPGADAPVQLLFAASLGVQMNADALDHFAQVFFPQLLSTLGVRLVVVIAGSNPSARVTRLCRKNNWTLRPDLKESELSDLYAGSAFAILPFAYTAGAKLKLLDALGRGVPVLGTAIMGGGGEQEIAPCLFSDDPEAWVLRLRQVASGGVGPDERERLIAHARAYSWERSAQLLFDALAGQKTEA